MKYFFVAGEASGDIHAAQVIKELRLFDPHAEIRFLGGDEMAWAAGSEPIVHYRRMAYMGFISVVSHLPEVLDNLRKAKEVIKSWRPDRVVLVDYPGFNLKLADYAHSLGIPVDYYIAPKLWAWKEYRLKKLKRVTDRVFSILPFEPAWFAERGLKVEYVGNPSVEEVEKALEGMESAEEFRRRLGLDSRPILALVPGSRRGEIKSNLPVMDAVARRHPDFQAVIAGAPSIEEEFYRGFSDFPVAEATTLQLMARSKAALVTSGTASLESALAGTPQVVCYRAVGWKWAANLFTHILKIPYVSLPNLIAGPIDRLTRTKVNREAAKTGVRGCVVPEMLVHNCTPDAVDRQLTPLLSDTPERQAQLSGYRLIRERLHTPRHAAVTVAELLAQ
ncbi:MAG: lipid-A-disaccharide synthase [Muribaculaceae bacterium]|nr:lipid-A-disaccharide synthase [Muribaculaceae bacterium]